MEEPTVEAGMTLVDATSAQTVITGITGVVSDNIAGILVLFGFAGGVALVRGLLNRAKKGRV